MQHHFAFVPSAAVTDVALDDSTVHVLAYLGTLDFLEDGLGGYIFQPPEEIAIALHLSLDCVLRALETLIEHGYVEERSAIMTFEEDGHQERCTVYRTAGVSP
jgi:hypothetical protein